MRSRGCGRRPFYQLLWSRAKRLLGLVDPPLDPPPLPPWEPALVPVGPPRRPRPSGAVALELPRAPEDVDARGFDAG
jgi:hypothetical protein